jgi:hypothetical protein
MSALARRPLAVAGAGLLLLLAFGCAVPGGYEGTYVGYYEPSGFSYGGWGAGYDVGPWHAGGFPHGAAFAGHQAFRPAPAGHAMPSIPSHARPAVPAHGQRRP